MDEANLSKLFGNTEPLTRVVNLKYEKYDVYIGRGSIFGNPFSHLENSKAIYKVSSRQEAINRYRSWILTQPQILEKLPTLKGKRLGCYCAPDSCHGEILVDLCERL